MTTDASVVKATETIQKAVEQLSIDRVLDASHVKPAIESFLESLKTRGQIGSTFVNTTHVVSRVVIDMPPQRGVRTFRKVYTATCILSPEAPDQVHTLKGLSRRRAKRWLREAQARVGSLVCFVTFQPRTPIHRIELKCHVENCWNNGSPRNGQEHDAESAGSAQSS